MQKVAKGKHPVYLGHPETDRLMKIVMALVEEVSVLRERLDTVERLAEAKGLITQADIDAYQPPEAVEKARDQWRAEYLERVLRVLQEE